MQKIEITTVIGCSNGCSFCPQKALVRTYSGPKQMSFDVFARAIDRLPKTVYIDMSGYAEPLLNPQAAAMARYARESGHTVNFYTTLVGLRPSDLADLSASQPTLTKIHVPDDHAFRFAAAEWIKLHELWLMTGIRAQRYMSMGAVSPIIEEYLRQFSIEVTKPPMLSRAGNLVSIPSPYISGPLICRMDRWHQNVMVPNGDVYLCCMDYSLTAPLGNLLRNSYEEIYETAERYRNEPDPPPSSICRRCEWASAAG